MKPKSVSKAKSSQTFTIDQVLIELCCLSYCDDVADPGETIEQQEAAIAADINTGLQQAEMADWIIVWGPVLSPDPLRTFMAYVAADCADNYAVVIRGTDPDSITGWITDLETKLVPAPYGDGVEIAEGALNAITVINGLTDSGSHTIVDYFNGVSGIGTVYVTGHSFGGTQATAYAPWLVAQGVPNVQVVAFAATTAGGASGADGTNFVPYFNGLFPSATMYFNTLDIVPDIWAELEAIKDLYGNAGGPPCPDSVGWLIDLFSGVSSNFADVNGQTALEGSLTGTSDWSDEYPVQHDHNTYASLLGAPVLSIDDIEIATVLTARQPQPAARAAAR
jgi:hypothetical protein